MTKISAMGTKMRAHKEETIPIEKDLEYRIEKPEGSPK